ncbi:MAG: alpha/beta hydrolase [Janthinobacterium lividum]
MSRLAAGLALATAGPFPAAAAGTLLMPLWPEGVPNGKAGLGPNRVDEDGRTINITEPSLAFYPPAVDRANGSAVIVCPGGGYVRQSTRREGEQYAQWLGTLGIAAFVLTYRQREFGHPAPLQDVLRAVRMVRSEAARLGLRSDRIGVMGSSAGGHLAATAGTLFDHPLGRTGAALDAVSARPDFLLLMYPVITMAGAAAHAGSRKALLGEAPKTAEVELMSLERQVTARTPPTLLVHTQADQSVPVENSILFYQALTRAGVPAEMYLFEHGAHGMGMRDGLGTASHWPRRAEEWLRERGLLERAG